LGDRNGILSAKKLVPFITKASCLEQVDASISSQLRFIWKLVVKTVAVMFDGGGGGGGDS